MTTQSTFHQKIIKALHDETQAINLYREMIEMISNERIQKLLREIRDDEKDHYRKLMILKEQMKR